MTSISVLFLAALGTAGIDASATPAPARWPDAQTTPVLRCASPAAETAWQAALGGVVGSDREAIVELVVGTRDARVYERTYTGGSWTTQRLPARFVAGDAVEQYYHFELGGGRHAAHLLFTIHPDRSGTLLWSSAEGSAETRCTPG